ncbi:hypothetical protein [Polaribacter cellanae]|uniref:Uncharacterized protein n=1 Tax=Polaribacter cellanae TaxID=2818493 RepID=A0A975H5F4_9FLAO|nr:hypothetical protein [Polaribacter cellanae]QTE21361.1 hypothetical protein J3359_11035 [Polaribacter cellanae]
MVFALFIAGNINAVTNIEVKIEKPNTIKIEKIKTITKIVDGKTIFLLNIEENVWMEQRLLFLLIQEKKLKVL